MPPADPAQTRTPPDVERIFAVLAEHGVDYVVVGGLAVQTHGHIRTTFDVDLYPRPTPANLASLADALNELNVDKGLINVLHDAPGAPAYEELRSEALELELGGTQVAIAGRDDLISMKRASARPVDLDDLAALTMPPPEDG